MGLFSSKKKVQVASVAMRLLDDKEFKYSSQMAMNDYLFKGYDMVQSMIDHTNYNLPNKMRRAYRLASKPDKYVFGLPQDSVLSKPVDDVIQATKNYLNNYHGKTVELLYSYVGEMLPYHAVWFKLNELYAYNNNQITVNGDRAFVYDVDLFLTQDTLDSYDDVSSVAIGLAFDFGNTLDRKQDIARELKPFKIADKDKAVVYYQYEKYIPNPLYIPYQEADINNLGSFVDEPEFIIERAIDSFEMDLSFLNPVQLEGDDIVDDNDYVQCAYLVDNEVRFFTYVFGSGGIVDIDTALLTDDGLGEYFPRIYTRIDYKDIDTSHDEIRKKSTQKMMRLFDLKLKKITKQINDSIGGELGNVVHIYLDMSVAINKDTWDFATSEYLYRYFLKLYGQCTPISETKRKGIIQVVADNISSQSIGFDTIDVTVHSGIAHHQVDNKPLSVGEYTVIKANQSSGITGGGAIARALAKVGNVPTHQIIYQETNDSYRMITITGLRNTHKVMDRQQTISGHDENLTIPLDRQLLNDLSVKERERLCYKSLHIQIGIRKVVKVKWYQRGIFKVVMVLVGLAIAYFTAGAGTPISQVLIQAGINALTGLAISYGVQLLLKVAVKLGLDAKIVAVIAFVGTLIALAKGKVTNISFKATEIMRALNNSIEAHNKMIGFQIQDVQRQMSDFAIYAKNERERLKRQQEMLLSRTIPLDLELLASPASQRLLAMNLGESPTQFYNRTVNIDVKDTTLNLIQSYVTLTTQLPDYQSFLEQVEQQHKQLNEPIDASHLLLV